MHSRKIVKNTLVTMLSKLIILLLGFVTRKLFLIYIGEQLLGLSSLYSNILDLLNMSELGISAAIQFALYKPLAEKDTTSINNVLYHARKIYSCIGIVILILGTICTFFIQYLIKDNHFDLSLIQISFLLCVFNIAASYFFTHKRLFLQTNEDLYLVNVADCVMTILFSAVKIVIIVVWGNYLAYTGIAIMQTLCANFLISIFCRKKYPNIMAAYSDNAMSIKIFKDLKNVIPLKISYYIYKSTDNIVISKFIGITSVAYYSNYAMIINQISIVYSQIINIICSSMGILSNEINNRIVLREKVKRLQIINYLFGTICFTELVCLLDPLIIIWLGENYVLNSMVAWLIATDFFTFIAYQPYSIIFNITGKFKEDRNITLGIAIANIVISVVLAQSIGISGVIIGTLFCDVTNWIYRVYKIGYQYFEENIHIFLKEMVKRIVILTLDTVCAIVISRLILKDMSWATLAISAIIVGIIVVGIDVLFYYRNKQFRDTLILCKKIIINRK